MLQGTLTRAESKVGSAKDLHHMRRFEDFRFLTGRATNADDIRPKDLAYLGLVRSTYAHAKITKIDFSKAKENPAFLGALTGDDLQKLGIGIVFENEMPGVKKTGRHHLALSKVRYVGEPVVAFLSRDSYSVEDIAEDIEVEYEPLSSVTTIEQSKAGKVLLYEEWGNNVFLDTKVKKGDAETALKSAPHVVKGRFGVKRQSGAFIEPRVVLVSLDKAKGFYNIYETLQSTHRLKNYLSNELKIPSDKFHITVPDVGGGFGGKGAQSYCAAALSCIFAEKIGLSVKWVSTRTEDLLETAQARDEYCDIELACDSNAKIVALKAEIVADGGAGGTLKAQPILSGKLLPGAYKIPNLEIRSISYATNKTPAGPIRGAGRPEGLLFIEMIIDKMARHLRLDPIGFRRLNAIPKSEFPYENGAGMIYDSGDLGRLLDSVKADYEGLLEWKRRVNDSDSGLLAGVNVALTVEDTGAQLTETAKVVTSTQNRGFVVYSGTTPQGQGLETALTILACEELHVSVEKIRVKVGDSNDLPTGVGTFGSRSIVTAGSAVIDACRKLKDAIISEASNAYSIPKDDIDLQGEEIFGKSPNRNKERLSDIWSLSAKLGREFEIFTSYTIKGQPFASGAHLCALTVDKESGKVKIHRYVVSDDCGRVINAPIVDGQLHGGIVHGIGDMLLAQIAYSEDGIPLTTNFMDYTIPTSLDVPDIETIHVETLSPLSLNGSKGVGESGPIGAFPAVLSALYNALQGMGDVDIAPATPEIVHTAMSSKRSS